MRWSGDGTKICIIYQDGAVIVGGVDGRPSVRLQCATSAHHSSLLLHTNITKLPFTVARLVMAVHTHPKQSILMSVQHL